MKAFDLPFRSLSEKDLAEARELVRRGIQRGWIQTPPVKEKSRATKAARARR